MKQQVYFDDFRRAFIKMGRADSFSYNGLRALYDYLIDSEYDNGVELELDVNELCGDWVESTIDEALELYNLESLDELRRDSIVLELSDDMIVYSNH